METNVLTIAVGSLLHNHVQLTLYAYTRWICSVLSFNNEWTTSDQCIKIHFNPLAPSQSICGTIDHSFTSESSPSSALSLSDSTEAPILSSRLHKLYNVRCRNKVDHLRAIHLFSYLARFPFYLPPPISLTTFETGFPLNFYDHSRREWGTTRTTR